MNKPLEITFQGVEKSDAIEAKIAEKAAKLEKHFDRITHFRVVVAAPHRHSHKGKIYQIKIEIGMPDRAPIVVTHEPEVTQANQDLVTAIREGVRCGAAQARRYRRADVGHGESRARPTSPVTGARVGSGAADHSRRFALSLAGRLAGTGAGRSAGRQVALGQDCRIGRRIAAAATSDRRPVRASAASRSPLKSTRK